MADNLTIGSCFSVRISSYDACGKFREHERSVAESSLCVYDARFDEANLLAML